MNSQIKKNILVSRNHCCRFFKVCDYAGIYFECKYNLKNLRCDNYRKIYDEIKKNHFGV